MGVSQLTTRLHPDEAILSWQSKLKMHAPNICKELEHHSLPINMLNVCTLAGTGQNHLTQRLLTTNVTSWIRKEYCTNCGIQNCCMGKLGYHYTVKRNTNQTVARQGLSRMLRSLLSTGLMKYKLFWLYFLIPQSISNWYFQLTLNWCTQHHSGAKVCKHFCFKCWKTHKGSMAVLTHAGQTLGEDATWNLRRKEPQTCGSWWRPQQSLSCFPEPGVWRKRGRLLEMKTRTQRVVTWPWPDGRLLCYGSWLLSHLYTSSFHSLATVSEDPDKSHSSQEELRGWLLLPATFPGALVCVHKHLWQEIKVFTMTVSQLSITGLYGVTAQPLLLQSVGTQFLEHHQQRTDRKLK